MNILLVGEYSRLHNSLKEGLQQLGHHVVIIGFKDGFKDYPVDFPLFHKWHSPILKKIRIGIYKLTGFDVVGFNEIDKKIAEAYITNHHPKYSLGRYSAQRLNRCQNPPHSEG